MQHSDLEKTKVLKTQRDSKSDVRKPNSKSVLKFIWPIRSVLHTDQISWTCPRASLVHRTYLVPLSDSRDVYRTSPILDQISPVNNMTVGIWTSPDKSVLHQTCSGPNPKFVNSESFLQWVPWAIFESPYRSNRYGGPVWLVWSDSSNGLFSRFL
jgi:hypothetical protein